MKKALLSVFFCFTMLLTYTSIQAQCTIDTNFTTILAYSPDPVPSGTVGQAYDQDITFVLPNDTVFLGFTAPFLEHEIMGIDSIPPGLTYACDISSCLYPVTQGQITRGCLKISGIPTAVTDTTDSVEVRVRSRIQTFIGNIDTTNILRINIKIDSPIVALDPVAELGMSATVFPNPATQSTHLNLELANREQGSIRVLDMVGREVQTVYEGDLPSGKYTFDVLNDGSSHAPGIYYIRVSLDEGRKTLTRKLVLLGQ